MQTGTSLQAAGRALTGGQHHPLHAGRLVNCIQHVGGAIDGRLNQLLDGVLDLEHKRAGRVNHIIAPLDGLLEAAGSQQVGLEQLEPLSGARQHGQMSNRIGPARVTAGAVHSVTSCQQALDDMASCMRASGGT